MLGVLVFARAHRLMHRLLFPEFCVVRSASEAHAKISYLLAYPEVLAALLQRVEHNVKRFIDRDVAPTVTVLQARLLHALEGRVDERCVLPMLRELHESVDPDQDEDR